eukprot:1583699-Pyramimonas_sp.AAC.1
MAPIEEVVASPPVHRVVRAVPGSARRSRTERVRVKLAWKVVLQASGTSKNILRKPTDAPHSSQASSTSSG